MNIWDTGNYKNEDFKFSAIRPSQRIKTSIGTYNAESQSQLAIVKLSQQLTLALELIILAMATNEEIKANDTYKSVVSRIFGKIGFESDEANELINDIESNGFPTATKALTGNSEGLLEQCSAKLKKYIEAQEYEQEISETFQTLSIQKPITSVGCPCTVNIRTVNGERANDKKVYVNLDLKLSYRFLGLDRDVLNNPEQLASAKAAAPYNCTRLSKPVIMKDQKTNKTVKRMIPEPFLISDYISMFDGKMVEIFDCKFAITPVVSMLIVGNKILTSIRYNVKEAVINKVERTFEQSSAFEDEVLDIDEFDDQDVIFD
jgi:hypothetical protein